MKLEMKTIFKRRATFAMLFTVIIFGVAGCKKGTFDVNGVSPNSPSAVPPKYSLSAALKNTASLEYSGSADLLQNWMGYWTQSGGFTASNEFVLYQLSSTTGQGNFDNAYINLRNYQEIINTAGANATQSNYKAISMIMQSYVYQRLVDLYNSVPYSAALSLNGQFSYKYDDPATIYKSLGNRIDSAITIINANANAETPGIYDVMFKGDMTKWVKFGNTVKLSMLMRQTQSSANGSLGDAGVKAALSKNPATGAAYVAADFLGAGQDAVINPGYSSGSSTQLNPIFADIVGNGTGGPGANTTYYRANAYAVNFYQSHADPRDAYFYEVKSNGKVRGRIYGSTDGTEANSVISAVYGTGKTSTGAYKGADQDSPIIPASISLFLQAEAAQRGYLTYATAGTLFNSAVSESFRFLGVTNYATAAAAYTAQTDPLTNLTASTNKIETIITQKWAASNTIAVVEAYSDYRRTGYPNIPVSIFPGNQATHIPYRLPYTFSELSYNAANVPAGGNGTEALTSKIFWMP